MARSSLALGALSLGLSVLFTIIRLPGYLVLLVGGLAVLFGILALARHRGRRTTIAWAAILGIALGPMSGLVVGVFFVVAQGGLSPGHGTYPDNPEMTAMSQNAYNIEHRLRAELPDQAWPATLTPNANGVLTYGGDTLARLGAGERFSYVTLDHGTDFEFTIYGSVPGELVKYDALTEEIQGECFTTDTTCGG